MSGLLGTCSRAARDSRSEETGWPRRAALCLWFLAGTRPLSPVGSTSRGEHPRASCCGSRASRRTELGVSSPCRDSSWGRGLHPDPMSPEPPPTGPFPNAVAWGMRSDVGLFGRHVRSINHLCWAVFGCLHAVPHCRPLQGRPVMTAPECRLSGGGLDSGSRTGL